MKEVEVKIKIDNPEAVKTVLEKRGFVFSKPVTQKDIIFADVDTIKKFDQFVSNVNFLRIRETGGKILFTLKRPQTNELDSIECEIEVNDAKKLEDIIQYLGYEKAVEVKKTRATAKHGDYEILLDHVEGLGDFLEVEKIISLDEDSEKTQQEILSFLKDVGIKTDDSQVTRGYDTLVYLENK